MLLDGANVRGSLGFPGDEWAKSRAWVLRDGKLDSPGHNPFPWS